MGKEAYYRLGERRPDDHDFLSLRLGLGNNKSSYMIQPLDQDIGLARI